MSPTDRPPVEGVTRRRLLTAAGTAVAVATGPGRTLAQEATPGNETATGDEEPRDVAQDEATEFRALLIPPEEWNQSLEGFFVHAGGDVNPASAAGADTCEYADWPDQESRSYEVTLIEHEELREDTARTTLYVRNDVDVPPGALFMVMETAACRESSYRGVYLQRLGVKNLDGGDRATGDVSVGVTNETATGDGTESVEGPGFGVVAALLGLGGAAGAARRWHGECRD